jgi:hypothetical protein
LKLQEKVLGELCTSGVLKPDPDLQCRYRIRGTLIDVDVLSPEAFNVGAVNPWFKRASVHAKSYDAGEGRTVAAVTPPYFLATKLVAFADRGPDAQSSKDAEDIVTLAVEVSDLVDQVEAAGLRADISGLWAAVLKKYNLTSSELVDLVDWHIDPRERDHCARVIASLMALAEG